MRHKRSQNAGVVYTLVDETIALVEALMRISLERKVDSQALLPVSFDNALARYCLADYWSGILRSEPGQVNETDNLGEYRPIGLAINRDCDAPELL